MTNLVSNLIVCYSVQANTKGVSKMFDEDEELQKSYLPQCPHQDEIGFCEIEGNSLEFQFNESGEWIEVR
jgi:hypothetical protein